MKAVVTVTKEFTFDSAHFLRNYAGNCANLHGHTYKCQVTCAGERNAQGMILDFQYLKTSIDNSVMAKFDHKCINEVVNYNPTAENMVADIARILQRELLHICKVTKVRLWETPNSFATWEAPT